MQDLVYDLEYERYIEDKQDIDTEIKLKNDWNFVIKYFSLSLDMSVSEFAYALKQINHYDWNITCNDLLQTIKEI